MKLCILLALAFAGYNVATAVGPGVIFGKAMGSLCRDTHPQLCGEMGGKNPDWTKSVNKCKATCKKSQPEECSKFLHHLGIVHELHAFFRKVFSS